MQQLYHSGKNAPSTDPPDYRNTKKPYFSASYLIRGLLADKMRRTLHALVRAVFGSPGFRLGALNTSARTRTIGSPEQEMRAPRLCRSECCRVVTPPWLRYATQCVYVRWITQRMSGCYCFCDTWNSPNHTPGPEREVVIIDFGRDRASLKLRRMRACVRFGPESSIIANPQEKQ
jgi:hypothetical protein